MLYPIAVVLIVLWLLGLVSGYTMDWFIHVLLVIAVILRIPCCDVDRAFTLIEEEELSHLPISHFRRINANG